MLTKPLKVQLVYSLILPHIDYCNALFCNLTEYLLHELTKVLFSAVRFIFGLRGSVLRMHMLPYLKSLHFLPVKFCTAFKIALLTHQVPAWLCFYIFEKFNRLLFCFGKIYLACYY